MEGVVVQNQIQPPPQQQGQQNQNQNQQQQQQQQQVQQVERLNQAVQQQLNLDAVKTRALSLYKAISRILDDFDAYARTNTTPKWSLSLSLSLSLTSFFVSPFKLFTFQRCKDFLGFCLNSKLDFLEIEWIFGFHFGFEGLQIAVFEEQQFASVTEKLKAIQFLEKLSIEFLFFVICLVTEKAKDSMISHFVLHYRFFLGFCFCLFGLKRNRRNLEKIIKI